MMLRRYHKRKEEEVEKPKTQPKQRKRTQAKKDGEA